MPPPLSWRPRRCMQRRLATSALHRPLVHQADHLQSPRAAERQGWASATPARRACATLCCRRCGTLQRILNGTRTGQQLDACRCAAAAAAAAAVAAVAAAPSFPPLCPCPPSCRACVIFSGGLDSSISACAGRDILGLSAAFTVLCTPAATDRHYAAQVAASLPGVQHHVIDISLEEALQELPDCVRVLQSFDGMTLRNDLAGVCAGGRRAAHTLAHCRIACGRLPTCGRPSFHPPCSTAPPLPLCPPVPTAQCAGRCARRRRAATPAL